MVDLDVQRECYVVPEELEPWMIADMLEISLGTGEHVVDANDFVPSRQQRVDQMRTEEARAAGHEHSPCLFVVAHIAVITRGRLPHVTEEGPEGGRI
jgi:hypothetical protein